MRLLLGFEHPQKGAIYYDGKDLERIDLRSLRRRVGVGGNGQTAVPLFTSAGTHYGGSVFLRQA